VVISVSLPLNVAEHLEEYSAVKRVSRSRAVADIISAYSRYVAEHGEITELERRVKILAQMQAGIRAICEQNGIDLSEFDRGFWL